MADRPGVEQVLTRLNDVADRLVSNKRFDDLLELVQKLVDGNKKLTSEMEAMRDAQAKELKAQSARISELEDFFRKELKKLRDELEESAGEAVDPAEQTEPPAWMKDILMQGKGYLGTLFGDEEVLKAARGRIRSWILKGEKKGLPSSDSEN